MSNGIEIEVKFAAKSATDLLRLPQNLKTLGWDLSDPNDVVMNDYYLDTPDLDLLQSGWTIRLRRASEQSKITLKSLAPCEDGVARREEYEEEINWDGSGSVAFPEDILDGRINDLVGEKTLWLLFQVEQSRTQYISTLNECTAEVSLDAVRWIYNKRSMNGYTAELELVDGSEKDILETQASLLKDFDWKLSNQSKFEVGLDLYNHF
ncbi:MAG: CYTH domain-containing protein [Planctomycetota bacterium]|jgi:inorganic triphosphatase YgiF|nr:CYTH domain-containing protein [Planctomycetota bacterium]MDG2309472.1 CYTH domain-containing protein [Planctomycetota bacterium]